MKYLKVIFSLMLATVLIVACGTGADEENNGDVSQGNQGTGEPKEEPKEEPQENIEDKDTAFDPEKISVELELMENTDVKYLFKLKNNSNEDITLTFSSLQEYDYIIKDVDGNKVYQYSDEMMFGEAFVEKTIPANDSYEMEIDLFDVIQTLESGMYSIEVWSSARETDGLRTEVELNVSNNLEPGEKKELGNFIGLIDSNSVEIKDEHGNVEAYRLTDEVKEYIDMIAENDPVTFVYYEEDGQLIVTRIIAD